MKKAFLMLFLVATLVNPAYALEISANQTTDILQDQPEVIISTLDELQAAVDTAEYRDTIEVAATIMLNGETIETDKNITLIRSEDLTTEMFRFSAGGAIIGFNFVENSDEYRTISVDRTGINGAIIKDCTFTGVVQNYIYAYGDAFSTNTVTISGCSFSGSAGSAIKNRPMSQITINDCIFANNKASQQGGAINNGGDMTITDCTITGNHANTGGGIFSDGNLTLSRCSIQGNTTQAKKFGTDILSFGMLTITDDRQNDTGFYDESTGEKFQLPLEVYDKDAKLIWLTDEQAADYFASEEPQEPVQPPEDDNTPIEIEAPTTPQKTADSNPPRIDYSPTYRPKRTSRSEAAATISNPQSQANIGYDY